MKTIKDIMRPQKIECIRFTKLKNLENLEISFNDKPITGIFGVNGSGKSTILHALACVYKPIPNSNCEDFKFSQFFTPTTLDSWKGSEFNVELSIKDGKGTSFKTETKIYKKATDRWSPRYGSRPERCVYYIGIDSCVPDMERDKSVSKIKLQKGSVEKPIHAVEAALSEIMNRKYSELSYYYNSKLKKYKSLSLNSIRYSSLYMGAGEQRLIKLLETICFAPEYSLILIDELDLTLHTDALRRLLKFLSQTCKSKKLQVIFTSHREELINNEYINTKHLINKDGITSTCLDHTTSDFIRLLTGIQPTPRFNILVEDKLAEALVRQVLKEFKAENQFNVIIFGAKNNGYIAGAGILLSQIMSSNDTIIILDGDVDRTKEDKEQAIKKYITGCDSNSQEMRKRLLEQIKQFQLPEGKSPEEFISDQLKNQDSDNYLIELIKEVETCHDKHELLDIPIENSRMNYDMAPAEIAKLLSETGSWKEYTHEIREWVETKILKTIN